MERERVDVTAGLESFPPILTPDQAARMLQISRSTLYQHVSMGRYRSAVRRGKPLRLHRDLLALEFFGRRRA